MRVKLKNVRKRTCFNYDPKTDTCRGLKPISCYECKFYKHKDDPINNRKMDKYRSRMLKEALNESI